MIALILTYKHCVVYYTFSLFVVIQTNQCMHSPHTYMLTSEWHKYTNKAKQHINNSINQAA